VKPSAMQVRFRLTLSLLVLMVASPAPARDAQSEYLIGPADVVHITVYENPALTTDVRVSETGEISFPLIGQVSVAGLSLPEAQAVIAKRLNEGHYVSKPQVIILPTIVRGSQITVVGHVNHPGRYPLETTNTHVSGAIAAAGGAEALGSDTVYLIGSRNGEVIRKPIELNDLFVKGGVQDDLVQAGDTLYVPRQPVFYVYGEVRSPGAFRLERHMTVMQGLALGGGATERGSQTKFRLFRQDDKGAVHETPLGLTDPLEPNDVIFVQYRVF
jgi:polysaccharide export outer membrane protein